MEESLMVMERGLCGSGVELGDCQFESRWKGFAVGCMAGSARRGENEPETVAHAGIRRFRST